MTVIPFIPPKDLCLLDAMATLEACAITQARKWENIGTFPTVPTEQRQLIVVAAVTLLLETADRLERDYIATENALYVLQKRDKAKTPEISE